MNQSRVSDPDLDEILENMWKASSQEEQQKWLDEAQRYIVEHAYVGPLYATVSHLALHKRVNGMLFSRNGTPIFFDAYLETTTE
jgi:ABC-type transport system substrate-binding protein